MDGVVKLMKVVERLRDPEKGCPWDLEQNHESLLPYFFEELHEYREALLSEGPGDPHTQEELGDLLFQVVFHAQLMAENKQSDFNQLAQRLAEKLIQRHPHVFDEQHPGFEDAKSVNQNWEKQKKESPSKSATARLESIPQSLPALQRAYRIGEKAASLGFDWKDNREDILAKVHEELEEFKKAEGEESQKEELGDLLFVLAQVARKNGWEPETILYRANQKFVKRFGSMEKRAHLEGKTLSKLDMKQWSILWDEAKKEG